MSDSNASSKAVTAGVRCDPTGKPACYTLTYRDETVMLEPGRAWQRVDGYKWVTRGVIEEPQSFHVLPDGTVEINAERIPLADPEGASRLAHEINKHHQLEAARPRPVVARPGAAERAVPAGTHYHVKLDQLGHLLIECRHGEERTATGLRGLASFAQHGLMRKPRQIHVDPLQRYLELDGARFECSAAGAQALEECLNARYAPAPSESDHGGIEIKENLAAATGFDIRFVSTRAGYRAEIKGHLNQERLDLLQDANKCDLLKPGILLKISAPWLLIRRRRPDGGEERIPELPDVEYRHASEAQLRHVFNHPLLRRTGAGAAGAAAASEGAGLAPAPAPAPASTAVAALRLAHQPQNRLLLWLECLAPGGAVVEAKAFTHHNVADLQQRGLFRPDLEVTLSLDHRTLSVFHEASDRHEDLVVGPTSDDATLARASQMLTNALKPVAPPVPAPAMEPGPAASPPASLATLAPPVEVGPAPTVPSEPQVAPQIEPLAPPPASASTGESLPVAEAAAVEAASPGPAAVEGPPAGCAKEEGPVRAAAVAPARVDASAVASALRPGVPAIDPVLAMLSEPRDPLQVNLAVFDGLTRRLGVACQTVRLSLERVFTDRRFDVLCFDDWEIVTITDLRQDAFHGFYLSHLSEANVILVYAREGRHVEWGIHRCLLQPAVRADPDEFKSDALQGLAQDGAGGFVFIVHPSYRDWVKSRERAYQEVGVRFRTPAELAAAPQDYTFLWPELNLGT